MTQSLTLNKNFCIIIPPYRTFLDTGLSQCVISKQLGFSPYSSCSCFIPWIFSIAAGRHIIAVVTWCGRRVIIIRFNAWFTRRVRVRGRLRHFDEVWYLVMLCRRNYFLYTTITATWGGEHLCQWVERLFGSSDCNIHIWWAVTASWLKFPSWFPLSLRILLSRFPTNLRDR